MLSNHKRGATLADSKRKKSTKKFLEFLIFVGPIFAFYTFSFAVPFLNSIYFSFTEWTGLLGTETWTGLDNYVRMFTRDPDFWKSLKKTFQFVFWNCTLTNIIAMIFALALSKPSRRNDASKALLYMPNMLGLVVTGFVWQFLLTRVMKQVFLQTEFPLFGLDFLGDPKVVVYSCVFVSLWAGIGSIMIIYISAIQGIDVSHVEAATVDGCNTWQMFWKVKLPEMLPTVSVGIFLNISGSIQVYDLIFSLTNGGPGRASELVMLNVFQEAFGRHNSGYANTKALFVTFVIMIVTFIQLEVTKERD